MQSVAARRFYGLFYRWSRVECSRVSRIRNFHNTRRLSKRLSLEKNGFEHLFEYPDGRPKSDYKVQVDLYEVDPRGAEIWREIISKPDRRLDLEKSGKSDLEFRTIRNNRRAKHKAQWREAMEKLETVTMNGNHITKGYRRSHQKKEAWYEDEDEETRAQGDLSELKSGVVEPTGDGKLTTESSEPSEVPWIGHDKETKIPRKSAGQKPEDKKSSKRRESTMQPSLHLDASATSRPPWRDATAELTDSMPQGRQKSETSSVLLDSPSINSTQQSLASELTSDKVEAPTEAKLEPPELSTKLRKVMRALPASVVVITTALTTSATGPKLKRREKPNNVHFATNGRGMTVSSFTTVTLTPHPIIQFNIKAPSRTLDALMETRHFFVHILQATDNGAAIAAAFTKGNSPDHNPFLNADGYGIRMTRVESRKLLTGSDGTYARPQYMEQEQKAREPWVPIVKAGFKHPSGVTRKEVRMRNPIAFDIRSREERMHEEDQEVHLPRLTSDAIWRVLHCKVLDKGERGSRKGDGFVRVGDHMMVIARVHGILGHRPVDEISEQKIKALAYAHGDFTSARSIIKPKEPDITALERQHDEEQISIDRPTVVSTENDSQPSQEQATLDKTTAISTKEEFDDNIDYGQGLTIRKIKTKGLSLREINELANYYADKANSLRSELDLPPVAQMKKFIPATNEPKELDDGRNPMTTKDDVVRIFKHFSQRGTTLDEIQETKQISKEFEIPRRIAQSAIEALPDADAEERKKYAVLKAAEELAARREEIQMKRAKSQNRASEDQSTSSAGGTDGKRRENKLGKVERPLREFTFHKYKTSSSDVDPELQPKLAKVWEKIEAFKNLDKGLRNSDDDQDGLFWIPTQFVKAEEKEKAREHFMKKQEAATWSAATDDESPESESIERALPKSASQLAKQVGRRVTKSEFKQVKMLVEESEEAQKQASIQKKRERERDKESKSAYQEPDPWAEEFL